MIKILRKNRYFITLGLILILSIFLRVYKLGLRSFWYDEACSLNFACRELAGLWKDHYMLRPLYFIFLNIWSHMFGAGEIISRIPSVVFGVLAVLLIFKLAEELFDLKIGFIAAFLLAVSYFHVAWSQQVRNYALLTLVCLISNVCYFRLIRLPQPQNYRNYAIWTILAILSSPIAIFVPIVHCFHHYFFAKSYFNRNQCYRVLLPISVVIFILFVFASVSYRNIKEDMLAADCLRPDIKLIGTIMGFFIYGGGRIAQGATTNAMREGIQVYHCLLTCVFSLFYLLGIFVGIRGNERERGITLYLLVWQWIPILILSLFYSFGFYFLSVKYLLFILPAYYIVISRGIASMRPRFISPLFLSIILLLSIPSFKEYYHLADYASWRELTAYLKSNIQKNDTIILSPLQGITPFWLYYKRDLTDFGSIGNGINGRGKIIDGRWCSAFLDRNNLIWGINFGEVKQFIRKMQEAQLAEKINSDLWIVVQNHWIGDAEYAALKNYINARFCLIEERAYPYESILLLRYRRKNTGY